MAKNKSNSGSAVNGSNFRSLIFAFHLTAAVQFAYAVYYDYTYVHFQRKSQIYSNPFGGKFKYLTFIDAILQTLYFMIAVANDVVGMNKSSLKNSTLLQKIRDFVMTTFAFPIAMNVGISFWGIYAIDRELVFPRELDSVFPSWLNHVMHTNIVICIMLELVTSFRVYPKRRTGLIALSAFMLSYLVWLHVIKYKTDTWVYPILDVLDLPYRIVFFMFILLITLSLYIVGESINNLVWRKELKNVHKKIK